jgi:6-phosphogluconolactonase
MSFSTATGESGSVEATTTELRVFDDLEALSAAAARTLVDAANDAIQKRGRFTIALSGGETPKPLYRRLASEHRDDVPWNVVHLFWSDERLVPQDDPDSNVGTARAILAPLPLLPENIHPPDTRPGDADVVAGRYETELERFDPLDAVVLGLGEDGHVASLFPGSSSLEESPRLVAGVRDSPKPPPVRITMTLAAIHRARAVHVLVAGEAKREALFRALHESPPRTPAGLVRSGGAAVFWADRAAAPRSDRL